MADITMKGVVKNYADAKKIGPVDLEIEDGEFVVLLGPTGSGKTAVLRLIAGLDEIDEGELTIDGKLANNLEPKERNLTVSMATSRLFPQFNLYDNLGFGLKMRKMPSDEINLRVREVADLFGLGDSLFKKPKMLTSLERQRAAIARSVIREPDACLFDDPFSGIDDRLTRAVRSDMAKIHYRFKSTFILTTRDQIDAMTLATKIVVMNDGKIEQIGTPREIYASPRTAFVAGYIGSPSINFCPAEIKKNGEEFSLVVFGAELPLSRERAEKIADLDAYVSGEKALTAAIRPDALSLGDGQIKMTADGIENYGSHLVVSLKTGVKPISEWSVIAPAESEIKVGDQVSLSASGDDFLLFDRETEISVFN